MAAKMSRDKLKVLCCSANIGNTQMTQENLAEWVPQGGVINGQSYDIIAVGMQESVFAVSPEENGKHFQPLKPDDDMDDRDTPELFDDDGGAENKPKTSTKSQGGWGALVNDKINNKCSKYIESTLSAVLGSNFRKVEDARKWQMRLYIFVRKDLKVTDVEHDTENTGIAGVGGNKGGQGVKITVNGTSLCFISCHLAAHEGEKHRLERNDHVREILLGIKMGRKEMDTASQFHHCFFMGDMNYRVDYSKKDPSLSHHGKSDAEKKELKKKKWDIVHGLVQKIGTAEGGSALDTLYACDELRESLEKCEVLTGFKTWQPKFAPTFKVVRWEDNTYVPNRIPSYCDRILLRSLPGFSKDIAMDSYESCPKYISSDHKPIRASFTISNANRVISCPRKRYYKVFMKDIHLIIEGRATQADGMSKPDPYIKVLTEPFGMVQDDTGRKPRSEVVQDQIETDIRPFHFWLLISKDELPKCHILFCIMDKDNASKDDHLGSVSLSTAGIAKSADTPTEFKPDMSEHETLVTMNGEVTGKLNFKIWMIEDHGEALKEKKRGMLSKLRGK